MQGFAKHISWLTIMTTGNVVIIMSPSLHTIKATERRINYAVWWFDPCWIQFVNPLENERNQDTKQSMYVCVCVPGIILKALVCSSLVPTEWLCSIFVFLLQTSHSLWPDDVCWQKLKLTECFCGPCSCIYYFALQSSHWAYKVQSWMLSNAAAEQQNSKSDKKSIML
jgi:hypothetical protein